jgi:G3E family GTPase
VALDRVRDAVPRPQRAVIEASGVADPALIAAYGHQPGLRLDGTVVVVDAESLEARARDRWVGDVVVGQIRAADLLAVTKTDLVGPDGLAAAHRRLEALAPGVPRIEVRHGRASLEALIGLERRGAADPADGGRAADGRFVAWHAEFEDPVDVDAVVSALRELGSEVVRAKGVVRAASDGRRVVLQRVGRRVSAYDDGAWRGGTSRLVAIAVRDGAPGRSPLEGLLGAGTSSSPAAGPPPVHSA